MAVAVDAAPANLKLDVGARGELVERLRGLLDQRPGILARQPSGAKGALAPISRTILPSLS
jgi:hypothetical protein